MDKLSQIATEAGVSPNTVLRVLRGENKEVWPSAIRRATIIRDLARKLAYMPNGSARAIRRGRFNCVALMLSADTGRSYLPNDLFNQIHDALEEQGIRLLVSKLDDEKLTSQDVLPSVLSEWSCDGLLINYTDHIPQGMVDLLARYRIPSIWINCRQDADCVFYDEFDGAMTATTHLLGLGHRRIAYLDFVDWDPKTVHYSRVDRYAGYVQAMRSAGLPPVPRERIVGVPSEHRLEATRALLSKPDRPTALIGYDAGERMLYAAALQGLRVPEDLSLVTFGARSSGSDRKKIGEVFLGRQVGTARLPTEKAGTQAVKMLLEKIANPTRLLPPSIMPLEFEPGDTCGPVPKAV